MTPDSELIARYRETQSEDAFAELVRRHVELVYRSALRQLQGETHLAEDVTQSVFTSLALKSNSLPRDVVLASWLYTTTRYAVSKAVRTEQRRKLREQKGHAMTELLRDEIGDADWQRMKPILDDAMHELDPSDREALLLRFFEGLSFVDVGAALRLSEDAARMRVTRALESLRDPLGRRGITSTAAAIAAVLTGQPAIAVPAALGASITSTALTSAAILSGGAGLGAGIKFFTAMSITKSGLAVASGVAAIAFGTAFYQSSRSHALQTAVALREDEKRHLLADVTSLRASAEKLQTEVSALQQQNADLRAATQRTPPAQAPAAAAAQLPLSLVASRADLRDAFARRAALTARVNAERAFKSAKLPPEKEEKFVQQSVEAAMVQLDLVEAMRSQGLLDSNDKFRGDRALAAPLQAHANKVSADLKEETRQLLGGDAYAQYEKFLATAGERNDADVLATRLGFSNTPLSSDQSDQLVQILVQGRFVPGQPTASPTNTLAGAQMADANFFGAQKISSSRGQKDRDWYAPVTDAALAEAAKVLSPAQLAALKQYQALQAAELLLTPPAQGRPSH